MESRAGYSFPGHLHNFGPFQATLALVANQVRSKVLGITCDVFQYKLIPVLTEYKAHKAAHYCISPSGDGTPHTRSAALGACAFAEWP